MTNLLAHPFPEHALPVSLLDAAKEVECDLQVPLSSVVSAMLAVLSLACQGRACIRKRKGLVSPLSLWFVVIQQSGERKSALLKAVLRAIYDFQRKYDALFHKQTEAYSTAYAAWTAERKAKLLGIQRKVILDENVEELKAQLSEIDKKKPKPPKRLKLVHENFTPEALMKNISAGYRTTSVMSDEGGFITRGRSFSDLGLLNKLWDSGTISVERSGDTVIMIENATLTMALFIQSQILHDFLCGKGERARDIGFLARTFVISPPPMAGFRTLAYSHPSDGEKLVAFSSRIEQILTDQFDKGGEGLAPQLTLEFSLEALQLWEQIHDRIELNMLQGPLLNFRDFGSKLADNIARLSGLLHLFEYGTGPISAKTLKQADEIVHWYTNEYIRIFSEYSMPQYVKDARNLSAWLWAEARRTGFLQFRKNDIRQYGPVRDKARLNVALACLSQSNGLAEFKQGKTTLVVLKH